MVNIFNKFSRFRPRNWPDTLPPVMPVQFSPSETMILRYVTELEVAKVVSYLKAKRTMDDNGMLTGLLKKIQIGIVGHLTHVINLSFRTGVFPNSQGC